MKQIYYSRVSFRIEKNSTSFFCNFGNRKVFLYCYLIQFCFFLSLIIMQNNNSMQNNITLCLRSKRNRNVSQRCFADFDYPAEYQRVRPLMAKLHDLGHCPNMAVHFTYIPTLATLAQKNTKIQKEFLRNRVLNNPITSPPTHPPLLKLLTQ